jgi:hypothetical protein
MRLIYTLFFCLTTFAISSQTTLYSFTSSPYINSTTTTANTTNSDVTISSGALSTNITFGTYFPNEPYIQGTGGYNAASQASAKEFCYTVTPNVGFAMSITNLKYQAYATNAGPSATGYSIGDTLYAGSNLGNGAPITQIDDVITNQNTLTTATEICIQAWDNGSRSTSGAGNFRTDEFELTITTSAILPVSFSNFDAHTTNKTVDLSWTTASEINNDHFEILQFMDG